MYVEGSIRTEKWQDKQGQDRYTTKIIASEMQMLGGRTGGSSSFNQDTSSSQPQSQGSPSPAPAGAGVDFDDDIPFLKILNSILINFFTKAPLTRGFLVITASIDFVVNLKPCSAVSYY